MGSAAVADLSRSAVREAGMAPQAFHVCLAMGCQMSRSNGVSSNLGGNFRGLYEVAWMATSPIFFSSSVSLTFGDKKVGIEPNLVDSYSS